MNFVADTLLLCGTKVNRENPQDAAENGKGTCAKQKGRLILNISDTYELRSAIKHEKQGRKVLTSGEVCGNLT